MSIERKFGIFSMVEVLFGKRVTEKPMQKVMAAMNYLYEAIGDEAPPDSGSQVIKGHDHADLGGLPIARGCTGSRNGGRNPLWSNDPSTSLNPIDQGLSPDRAREFKPTLDAKTFNCTLVEYASPGIDTVTNGVYWDMRMQVYWPEDAGYDCYLQVRNLDIEAPFPWVRVETIASTTIKPSASMQEVRLKVPCRGDYYNRLMIEFRAETGTPDSSKKFSIYRINNTETAELSQPKGQGKLRYL